MQTFLPYPSFPRSARTLDRQRLGKQRVEAVQIMNVLLGKSEGWGNHPITRMWRGHAWSLLAYLIAVNDEWLRRGYDSTRVNAWIESYMIEEELEGYGKRPPWLGSRRFHLSHQSNLMRKMPEHYSQFEWKVRDDLPYVWPV